MTTSEWILKPILFISAVSHMGSIHHENETEFAEIEDQNDELVIGLIIKTIETTDTETFTARSRLCRIEHYHQKQQFSTYTYQVKKVKRLKKRNYFHQLHICWHTRNCLDWWKNNWELWIVNKWTKVPSITFRSFWTSFFKEDKNTKTKQTERLEKLKHLLMNACFIWSIHWQKISTAQFNPKLENEC